MVPLPSAASAILGGAIRPMGVAALPQVVALGIARVPPPHEFPEHRLDYPELNCITAGRYTCTLNGVEASGAAGHVYGYDAGDVFRSRVVPADGELVCHWLRFTWPAAGSGPALRLPRVCALSAADLARFLRSFDQAQVCQAQEGVPARLRASGALLEMLALLTAADAATAPPRTLDHRLAAGRAVLERDVLRPMRIAVAARAAGMRPDSFIRAFRRALGVTPLQHLIGLRLSCARHLLLAEPDLPIEVVAQRSGFSEPRHFARLFRRRFGHPPSALRPRLAASSPPPLAPARPQGESRR